MQGEKEEETSFSLDFSFLSQQTPRNGVQSEGGVEAGRKPPDLGSEAPAREPQPLPTSPSGPTLQLLSTLMEEEKSRANDDTGVANGSVGGRMDAAQSASGFSRAFAHIKETSSYTPPAPSNSGSSHDGKGKTPNPKAVQVSRRQAGNPVLKHIRNVSWEYADITPDYQMGAQTCALFLSVRYHLLKPKYIYARMEQLQRGFRLRVLLCLVDSEECHKTLEDVHQAAILNGWTIILAWSPEEAARYLETYQAYEKKQADAIQERVEGDYFSRLTDVLTTIRSVNRTDVATMSSSLGTLAAVMGATKERLSLCPGVAKPVISGWWAGIGDKKAQRIFDAFHEPFRTQKKARVAEQQKLPQASHS